MDLLLNNKEKIVIIDYNSGNVRSISNMLLSLGKESVLSNKKEDILSATKLIFPGQGHFEQAMVNLKKSGVIEPLKEAIEKGIDFLGICLGLQILFEHSEEAPNTPGLGILKGVVKKFQTGKIPQIGWNKVQVVSNKSNLQSDYFYFVNSYYVIPQEEEIISSKTLYGVEFCSSVKKNNLSAVQFHPEKSAQAGSNFLKKWLE